MSTLIIKLDEANTSRILDVLGDELVRGSIGAYHLLIEDGTPLDPTDGSPHLAPERDEAMLYAAAPELLAELQGIADYLKKCNGLDAMQIACDMTADLPKLKELIAKATQP
jgi:hypothetical protein